MTKKSIKRNFRLTLQILVIFFGIATLVAGMYYIFTLTKKPVAKNDSVIFNTPILKNISKDLQKDLTIKPHTIGDDKNSYGVTTTNDDGWSIYVSTPETLFVDISSTDVQEDQLGPQGQQLASLITKVMEANGLNKVPIEPPTRMTSGYPFRFDGKDQTCNTTILNSYSGIWKPTYGDATIRLLVSCTNEEQIAEATSEQLHYLQALGDKERVISEIIRISDDKAILKGSMGVTYLYNTGGGWVEVFSGNGFPSCSELAVKNIPQKYTPDCYDDENTIKRGNFD